MNKKLDWAHQRDSYLLRTHFTPRECQNIQVVNSLSKYICHKRSDPLKEGEDSETRSKEVGWLLNLGQKLITRRTKLSSARDIQTYNSINRPRDFELEEMLLHGGLEETVEKLKQSPEHRSKQALLMVPGIGPDEVAELSEIGICSVDDLKNELSLSNVQARRWRPRDRNQELAQGRYFEQEEKPET
ncbi:uncharacterized protein JCM6883_005539, partial [Sporobolomyces salmoneus]|uniref:uncharacterized protein n=1 Tax=Sporobolomyces salmoneus TaxID=183962 RepID=UPI00317A9CCE